MPHFRKLFMENSQERLIDLVTQRARPGADKEAIDRRIWNLFGEDWTVMFTDLAGFSRNSASFGIIHFVQVIIESEQLFAPILERNGGFVIKREGDSLMILFRDPVSALECAIEMQQACQSLSHERPDEEKVILCLGLSHGRILRLGTEEVYGEAVNSASKLGEDTAGHHEILVTKEFVEACGGDCGNGLEPIDYVPPGSRGAYRVVYDRG